MNAPSKDNLYIFCLRNPKIELTKIQNDYKLSFEKAFINNSENEVASYYDKGIYKDGFIKGEDVNSIAISESKGVYLQSYNTTTFSERIYLYLRNVEKELACIKVLAKITQNAVNEYLLYDTYIIDKSIYFLFFNFLFFFIE